MKNTARAAADSTAPNPATDEAPLAAVSDDEASEYSEDAAILYALGAGFGSDPAVSGEFAYAYRQPLLKTVPTFAAMLPKAPFPPAENGWDPGNALCIEQKLELFRPLPARAQLLVNRRVIDVTSNRDGMPVRVVVQSEARLAADDTAVFALASALVPANEVAAGRSLPAAVARDSVPKRDPDLSCDLRTRPDQALLFCLTGDHAACHVDAAAARDAGFDAPLLQPRCVSGIACRAILRTICDYDFTLIKGMEARFPAPVFPGDVVTTDMWQDRNIVSFRCSVRARKSIVLDGGRCTLSA